ncbi:two-component regulator propeller domain-containing protein [Draconibacterium sp. IB214405]|uniref:hybrid sensor histidine kinase/response regulator transcription factor n=1 Tax=Draconibacterium sp. IB214405 TaxID=3097352 RepID=UPI002A0FB985|nr:two-component regulator propeller domain-containing protein [Draconibacterium sp. IB214405]MDX8337760.1 two-component regulator propeller domain-containing protein [Draconibacterium sp. IB214405]
MLKYGFLFFLFFRICFGLEAQNSTVLEQPRLNYLTTNEGLPQNTIDCILKDSKGFMWFGTWNGLCRFDGYTFQIFKSQQEKWLPGNFIQTLCEDQNGNLWVGTNKGLAFFDYSRLKFTKEPQLTEKLGGTSITHIINDHNNTIWVATAGKGIWKINYEQQTISSVESVFENQLTDKNVNTLCLLPDNHLLAGTNNGLTVINLSGAQPKPVWERLYEYTEGIGGLNILTILKDRSGDIWLGTVDVGLYHYSTSTLNLTYYGADNNNPNDLNHLSVYDIIEDRHGIIMVGTLGGLNFYDPATQRFTSLPASTEERKYLNNPFINSLYADELGNIWIGTEKGGINHYNSYQKPFNAITHEASNPNSISHNTINSVYSEKDVLWVGTAGGGLNRISKNGRETVRFRHFTNDSQSINSDFVTSFLRDSQNHLLVGTWGGGLNKLLSEKQNRFEILVNIPGDEKTLCSSFISSLEYLDDKNILIGTRGGLDIYNPENGIFLHVHEKMNIDEDLEIGCLLTDSKNRVWVGTENGLYRFNRSDLLAFNENTLQIDFEKYVTNPADSASIPGNYVISLFEGHDGTVWLGTYGNGICKFTEGENGGFVTYNEQNGLCNNVAYGIEEDAQGNLWISTDNGLSKFSPEAETFQNFYSSDGLLSDQFYWSSSCSDEQGNLYFGGVEGLNYFNPAEFESYPNIPKPVFTQFSVFSDPVVIGEKYHSKVLLDAPISETDKISLSYKDAVFSIEFSALDYFQPGKIKYAYQMEGVDQDWVEVPSTRRFANYTNLSGGEYTFKVKAANSDGIWSENYTALTITIVPPFWETAWFQMLAIMLVITLVLIYIRYRTQFLKEQKRKLEQQVRERTHKIEEQKEELEKQNEQIAKQRDEVIALNEKVKLVNQLRLRFFTNISHEFRTPLTLIIDPLEQLMKNLHADTNTHNTLSIINRNAQRLLHLINQLLYFRRIETGKLKLNVSKGNLQEFLHGIFESFKDLAEHQKINYQFVQTNISDETWFDAEKIENIFYNLLSNAFKNTPPTGSITLKIDKIFESRENCIAAPFVAISIIDTGRGISKEHLPHIFNRFYKDAESGKETDFTSSGIGLALTYEIVQALNGEIKVQSEPRKGSIFTVCMPYSKERFKPEDINETSVPTEINLEGRVNVLSEHIVARSSGYEHEEEASDNKTKPTILIVEDNFDLRSFLMQTLRSEYRVLGAENGKIGLEMAKKYSPELIISDVMMPVMDGIELCSRLKKNIQTSHIPIILLTAKNMVESWIEGLETGADDYIPKPFNLQILQLKMRNLIESRRKIKTLFSGPEEVAPEKISLNKLDEEFITKAYQILEKNYSEPDFSVEQFAREMFVSRSLLYKKIKALTDLNITDFINSYKLKKSVELIKSSDQSISEIAFKTGFNDPKYFSRIFKKFYGISPRDYLKKT